MINNLEKEIRPWGSFQVISNDNSHKLKFINVEPKQKLSYQYHNKRSEIWVIIKGKAHVTIDGILKVYKYGEAVIIPQGSKHRVENQEDTELVFIEVQTGTYFGEDDIIRIEDDYGRK